MMSRFTSTCALLFLSGGAACTDKSTLSPPAGQHPGAEPAKVQNAPALPVTLVCADARDDECPKLTDTFYVNTPKLFASYTTSDLPKAGSKAHIDWIADDVGTVAPPKSVILGLDKDITSASLLNGRATSYTITSNLSKPTAGWPVGKYHVEFKLDGKTVSTVGFKVVAEAMPTK